MHYALSIEQFDALEIILQQSLIELGVSCVVLIDLAGNVITELHHGETHYDTYSMAALAAGNFGAMGAMAKIIGEEDFSLLFHKGEKENIHFSKVMDDFLLVTIFGKDVSLGFLRMKVAEAIRKIEKVL